MPPQTYHCILCAKTFPKRQGLYQHNKSKAHLTRVKEEELRNVSNYKSFVAGNYRLTLLDR